MALGAHGDDRIDENEKIGPATDALDRVWRFGLTRVEMGAGRGSEMPAGGKAHEADAGGIKFPYFGVGADGADGPLGIVKRHMRATLGQAILQHDASNAVAIQPVGDAVPFRAGDEPAVASARTNDD